MSGRNLEQDVYYFVDATASHDSITMQQRAETKGYLVQGINLYIMKLECLSLKLVVAHLVIKLKLLPSGRRYRSLKAGTNRLKNSFYPRAAVALTVELNEN